MTSYACDTLEFDGILSVSFVISIKTSHEQKTGDDAMCRSRKVDEATIRVIHAELSSGDVTAEAFMLNATFVASTTLVTSSKSVN